jgi:uncharacterized protein
MTAPGVIDRAKSWMLAILPTREAMEQQRWLRPVAHRVLAPALWRFHRRSVPRGVALGLLVGIFLLIPGLQIAVAALVALPFRANIPLAVAMTFLSNPLTTPLILLAAVDLGNRLLGLHANLATLFALKQNGASLGQYWAWLWSDAAPAIVAGLAIIALVSAVVGYMIAFASWRWWIVHKWRKRNRLAKAAQA